MTDEEFKKMYKKDDRYHYLKCYTERAVDKHPKIW